MQGQSLLSVVIPVSRMSGKLYNLEQTLLSTVAQNVQIVLVHDVNDEKTGKELKTLLNKLKIPNVKFIEGIFGGPGAARNQGIEFANGKWLAFWDSDDLPNIDSVINAISNADPFSEVIIGGYQILDSSNNSKIIYQTKLNQTLLDVSINPGLWRMVFLKAKFLNFRFPHWSMSEDQSYLIRSRFFAKRIEFSNDTFYTYVKSSSSQLTSRKDVMKYLVDSTNEAYQNIRIVSKEESDLISLMYLRQTISGLKNGSLKIKCIVGFKFLTRFGTSSFKNKVKIWNLSKFLFNYLREANQSGKYNEK